MLKFLYPEKEAWGKEIYEPLKKLLMEYRDAVELEHLGFPENYAELLK